VKPVTQTTFWDADAPPSQQRGNCLTAVVASLLELTIDQVPDFVQDHVDHMDEDENAGEWDWWTRLHRFIVEQGRQVHYLSPVENPTWEGSPENWFPVPEPGEHYTVSGISPRDPSIHHIVIYRDGVMVHDPHPDRTGLTEIDDSYHWTLREVRDVDA
jgi:hypothetical protein